MKIPSFVYEKIVSASVSDVHLELPYLFRQCYMIFCILIRRVLIKLLRDPTVTTKIHDRNLQVSLSHQVPFHLKRYPEYDRLPRRIGNYLKGKDGSIRCIDVGANIGDSIAAFCQHFTKKDFFLAIEPNPTFLKMLMANWGDVRNVKILPYMCSSKSLTLKVQVGETCGTASMKITEDGNEMEAMTIDKIISQHLEISDFNIPLCQ